MPDHVSEKIERFKESIGFDARLRSEPPGRFVLVTWPDMLSGPGIAGQGWTIASDTTQRVRGGAARSWVLRKDADTVVIDAFVSSRGVQGARQNLLQRATTTMKSIPSFVPGPPGLGSLAVWNVNPAPRTVLWVYYNVCVMVHRINTETQVVPIAEWLQALLAKSLVNGDSAPANALPPALKAPSHPMAVGESIEFAVARDSAAGASGYDMKSEYDATSIDVSIFEGPRARLTAIAPGPTMVVLFLVNIATLISAENRMEIDIVDGPRVDATRPGKPN